MTHQLAFILVLFLPFCGFSQVEITGTVQDTNGPISFANVMLSNSDAEMVTGTTSDANGRFSIQSKPGAYQLKISFIGYATWQQDLVLDTSLSLGVITLSVDENQLEEIVLKNEKPLFL